jgi:hypothetical protein
MLPSVHKWSPNDGKISVSLLPQEQGRKNHAALYESLAGMSANEETPGSPPIRFIDLSPAARNLWAKSGEAQSHSLLAHMLDVAAVAAAILAGESPHTLELGGGLLRPAIGIGRTLGGRHGRAPRFR